MTGWTIPNKWRGKVALIIHCAELRYCLLTRVLPDGRSADLYYLADDAEAARRLLGTRTSGPVVLVGECEGAHGLRQGPAHGFGDDRGALSGRHMLPRALSLAVALGASTVGVLWIGNAPPSAPMLRNLRQFVRPLKSRRVFTVDATPEEFRVDLPFPCLTVSEVLQCA